MGTVGFPVALLLREYMEKHNLTQTEVAHALGVSQPYLSRILSRKMSGISHHLVERIVELVGLPALIPVTEDIDRFSALYERGIYHVGAGDLVTAEVCFVRAAQITEPRTADALDLRARSQARLAGIRRDRDQIDGDEGAVSLYTDALGTHRDLGHEAAEREILFMLGACAEMRKDNRTALVEYDKLIRSLTLSEDPWLATRLNLRSGALLTKTRRLGEAEKRLRTAVSTGVHLEEPGPYSFANEKLALLLVRKGDLDGAWQRLQHVELGPTDHLRHIQNLCVRATLHVATGDGSSGESALKDAQAIAEDYDFGHQLRYVRAQLARLEREW